jgi:hypothetical protein
LNSLRSTLYSLYDSPLGDRLRATFGIRAPINIRPFASRATISDLFPWRVDETWETCFHLINLPSLIQLVEPSDDLVTFALFGADGRDLCRYEFLLKPYETRQIEIADLLGSTSGHGAFACFHESASLAALSQYGSYLSDRGYVGFRRKGDRLWSYVHGNLHVLSHAPKSAGFDHVGITSTQDWAYRPQVQFNDARAFDLVYSNPTRTPLNLSLRFLNGPRTAVKNRKIEVPIRGTVVISHDNRDGSVTAIESSARTSLWRPIIFKHYESHFDVFHG